MGNASPRGRQHPARMMDVGESRSSDRVCDSSVCSLGAGICSGLGLPRFEHKNAAPSDASGRNGGDRSGRGGWPFASCKIGVVSVSAANRRWSALQNCDSRSNATFRHVHTAVGVKKQGIGIASGSC